MNILVITPSLGESAWLHQTVTSVRSQRFAATHLLVTPVSRVSMVQARFPETTVVGERGVGLYAAINAGIAAAKDWDAFTYINDDDVLLAGLHSVVRSLAGLTPAAKVIGYGGVLLINSSGRRLGAIPISPAPSLNRALYAQRIEPVYQHGTVVTRGAWESLGGFDQSFRFCGDSEFLARACMKGIPFVRIGGAPVAAFRLRPEQLTKNRSAMEAERDRVDRKLGLLAPRLTLRHHWARFVFRAANLPVYAERAARFGFVSFDNVLERAG